MSEHTKRMKKLLH